MTQSCYIVTYIVTCAMEPCYKGSRIYTHVMYQNYIVTCRSVFLILSEFGQSDTTWQHGSWSQLDQVIDWHIFRTKPLLEPMVMPCQHLETNFNEIWMNILWFSCRKMKKNVVCKMVVILSQPGHVSQLHYTITFAHEGLQLYHSLFLAWCWEGSAVHNQLALSHLDWWFPLLNIWNCNQCHLLAKIFVQFHILQQGTVIEK